MDRLSRICFALLFALALVALPACETTEGMGEDIEEAGEDIQDAAD